MYETFEILIFNENKFVFLKSDARWAPDFFRHKKVYQIISFHNFEAVRKYLKAVLIKLC